MSKFSDRFAALPPQKRELLERRLKERGMDMVLPPKAEKPVAKPLDVSGQIARAADRQMQFSIFFFSGDGSVTGPDKYRLLVECARFADRHGFAAVWTPERHFEDFGGLYPNPSVLGAALAVSTERVQIRAGSVALPLHHPIRVAEEWSVVDNLSNGRVAISFASGWHPNDFVMFPDLYESRKEIMFSHIRTIQKLWAGEAVKFQGVGGKEVEVKILPKPIQPRLPVWITTSGTRETWAKAGEVGANILAALVGYSFDELTNRIQLYRESLLAHGHAPESGKVTLMLHTFLGGDDEAVREKVRKPMCSYLRTYMKQTENVVFDSGALTEDDKENLVSFAFENYFQGSALLGTVDKCARLVDRLIDFGVDEIACLVDFGVEIESVLEGLEYLDQLKDRYQNATGAPVEGRAAQ